MKIIIYKLILWWLKRRLRDAENDWNGSAVDRLVNATDMIRMEINAAR